MAVEVLMTMRKTDNDVGEGADNARLLCRTWKYGVLAASW